MTYYLCGPHRRCRDVEITSRLLAIRCDDCGKGIEFDAGDPGAAAVARAANERFVLWLAIV